MRVLVTNDDGVFAPGLHALANAAVTGGHEVRIVAPAKDHSGFAAALGPLHVTRQVGFERVPLSGVAAGDVVAVDGPPALCVLGACLGGFGPPPEIVLSGVNLGANSGRAVLHSGTVGAAFTANNFGVAAIAVSLAGGDVYDWEMAATVAVELIEWTAAQAGVFTLNVNVPNVPGPTAAHVAALDSGGNVQTAMIESGDGVLSLEFGPPAPHPGTDTAIIDAGCVAITPLVHVRAHEIVMDGAIATVDSLLGSFAARERVA